MLKKPKVKKPKVSVSTMRFKKLVIPRPDVLHGFLKHSEINQYLDYLERRYSNFVKVHTLGLSYENRELKGIEIDWCCAKNIIALSKEAKRFHNKPTSNEMNVAIPVQGRNMIFVEAGTHAREWITISVALNIIYQLTERNMRNRDVLRRLRFLIVPVVNPDGYEYTRSKHNNRRWRKNRRPHKHSVGTDCNRNFDFHWEKGSTKANRNTYKGEKPFSEPETRALAKIMHKLAPKLLFFLSLHSYAQSIMYPWGWSKELPETWAQLQKLASAGRNAIKAYNGRVYRTGSIANMSKRTIPGSIVDYAFGVIKVPLALVMELPATEFGFQPPPEAISPIGHESWCGIREMCKCALDLVSAFPQSETSVDQCEREQGQGDGPSEETLVLNKLLKITTKEAVDSNNTN